MASYDYVDFDYASFLQTIPAYMYQVAFDSGQPSRTFHSPGCLGILGYSAEEYDADPALWFKMIHGLDKQEVRGFLRWFNEDPAVNSAEITHRIIHKNGSALWVLNRLTKAVDPITMQPMFSGVIIDVTAQKEMEAQLRESERRYRGLFENASDMVFTLDSYGRFTSINHAALTILGYKREELILKNISDIISGQGAQALFQAGSNTLEDKAMPCLAEVCMIAKDGSVICAEASEGPIYREGRQDGIQVIARDMTSRKRELREKQKILENLRERVKELTCLHKASRRLIGLRNNLAESLKDVVDMVPAGWKYPDVCCARISVNGVEYKTSNFDLTPWRQSSPITCVRNAGGLIEVCYLEPRPDEDEGPFIIEERNLINSLGALIGSAVDAAAAMEEVQAANTEMTYVIHDAENAVIHAEEARERAESASRLKDNFVSLVAHDLKSPFSAVIGLLKMLHEGHFERLTENQREVVSKITSGCQNMLHMVGELMSISRLRTGLITPLPQFHEARMIAENVLATYAASALEKEIKLHNDVPRDVMVYADLGLFTEALSNLVDNSVKFCVSGDTIWIRLEQGANFSFIVKDTGIGMDQKTISRLFRMESKISRPGTRGERGTGLGLTFVMDIMKVHSGSVTVESQPGAGSEFTLALPHVQPYALMIGAGPELASDVRDALGALDARLVEIQQWLRIDDFPGEAMPHILIVNVGDGESENVALLERLKKRTRWKHLPLLAVGTREAAVCKHSISALIDDFIRAPFNHTELRIRVKRLLGGGQILM